MLAFTSIFLLPVEVGGDPPSEPPQPDLDETGRVVGVFRKMLLEANRVNETVISVHKLEPLTAIWIPAGYTAGVALWARQRDILAASVLKSGLDKQDDARAIALLVHSARLPFSADTWGLVVRSKPPLLANLYHDESAIRDPAIIIASTGLAVALFGLFGISGDPDEPDLSLELPL